MGEQYYLSSRTQTDDCSDLEPLALQRRTTHTENKYRNLYGPAFDDIRFQMR